MNLNLFMENGISNITKTVMRFYLNNRKGRAFMARFLPEVHKSTAVRKKHEQDGTHVPPFLIASIASRCNLRCTGCYARAGGGCGDLDAAGDMSAPEWKSIFAEAAGLGVSFILLAGGEPLTRPDVIHAAAEFSNIIFPVFTNGTMIGDEYIDLFDRHRNLIPVISIEGDPDTTDQRRGYGIYANAEDVMIRLKEKNVLFGISVTVTHKNIQTVSSGNFISEQYAKGCGIIFFIEYVPVAEDTEELVLNSHDVCMLEENTAMLKKRFSDTVIISFPGDEEAMGGCLASGRGFFHINPQGGAEPCPFSPFSRHNLKTDSITEVLRSGFFRELREIAANAEPQQGGCTLFDHKEEVQSLFLRN